VSQGKPLSHLRELLARGSPAVRGDEDSARRQWWAALATLQDDYLMPRIPESGAWLASPLPALYEPSLLAGLRGWVWAPDGLSDRLASVTPMLPGRAGVHGSGLKRLPLQPEDGTDPLLLIFTSSIQLGLALHGDDGHRRLVMRSDPRTLSKALTLLDERLQHEASSESTRLRETLRELGALRSDPDIGASFWPRLSARLAGMAPSVTLQPVVPLASECNEPKAVSVALGSRSVAHPAPLSSTGMDRQARAAELQLLEALTHEVRTPLATIRTLIRSLLRRAELDPLVRDRLQRIDAECSEQIDRFGLIFHAAELERRPPRSSSLALTDLSALLEQLSPGWVPQLKRRDLEFRLIITPDLPPVLSDPSLLETTLGGLMDRFSRSLQSGQLVALELSPAGDRLKLQLTARERDQSNRWEARRRDTEPAEAAEAEAVGPVLSWNPETGSLQLSQEATQRLFHSLGGRLTERSGQTMVVFFPVAESERASPFC